MEYPKHGLVAGGLAIACFATADIAHYFTEHDLKIEANNRVNDIQVQNEQLRHQLETGGKLVAKLVLRDGRKTFEFQTSNELHQPEKCTGEYKISNGHASIVGSVACTTVERIGSK